MATETCNKSDPRNLLKLYFNFSDSLIEPHPNTYAFTKRLAESIVEEYGNQLPIIVARASVVLPVLKEPIPGWVDSLNGAVGFLPGIGKGMVRSIILPPNSYAELIPVDTACNAVIIAAWRRATRSFAEIPVINLSISKVHSITWDELIHLSRKEVVTTPYNMPLWYPDTFTCTNIYFHDIIVFLFQYIPAYFIDILLALAGKKRFMVRYQTKIKQVSDAQFIFLLKKWNIQTNNFLSISAELCEEDRKTFYTDALKIDQIAIRDFVLGTRRFCLKENLESLPSARRFVKFLYYLDRTCKVILGIAIVWLVSLYVY